MHQHVEPSASVHASVGSELAHVVMHTAGATAWLGCMMIVHSLVLRLPRFAACMLSISVVAETAWQELHCFLEYPSPDRLLAGGHYC
jgi:hypothetical protein